MRAQPGNVDIAENGAGLFQSMCATDAEYRAACADARVISALVDNLRRYAASARSSEQTILDRTNAAILNLVTSSPANKAQFLEADGMPVFMAVIDAVKETMPGVVESGFGALRNIIANNPAGKSAFIAAGGCARAVDILASYPDTTSLVLQVCEVIASISMTDAGRAAFGAVTVTLAPLAGSSPPATPAILGGMSGSLSSPAAAAAAVVPAASIIYGAATRYTSMPCATALATRFAPPAPPPPPSAAAASTTA